MDDLPVQAGTYALILDFDKSRTIRVGQLGWFNFPPGYYVYLGSAQGSGGLRGRLSRHLRRDGKPHWHIDRLAIWTFLRGYAYVLSGVEKTCFKPMECIWSQALASIPTATIPVPKFGASDCKSGCLAHLLHFPGNHFISRLPDILNPSEDMEGFKLVYPWIPD